MDFNSHQEEVATISASPLHHSTVNHHHSESVTDHHESKKSDDCCHDEGTEIALVDKVVPQAFSVSMNYLFLITLASNFYRIDSLNLFSESHIRYFVRRHKPPIPDIRIAIRSFQI